MNYNLHNPRHSPVGSVHGLLVHRGVPVAVVEDDCVGGGKVDAEAPGPGAEQEDEDVLPGLEVGHHISPLVYLAAAVQSHVAVLPDRTVLEEMTVIETPYL